MGRGRDPIGEGQAVPARGEPSAIAILGAVLGAWTLYGLARCALWWWCDPVRYSPLEAPRLLVSSVARAWGWAAMSGLIWLLCRQARWGDRPIWRLLVVHVPAATVMALLDSVWYRAVVHALNPAGLPRPFVTRFLLDLTGNMFLYFAVVAVAYARQHRAVLQACHRHALRLEAQLSTARLTALNSELQPHFLCNALSAVAELIHHDVARARAALGQVRALLAGPHIPVTHEVRLGEELAQVEPYLALQRTRFGDRLSLEVIAEPATLALHVPTLILQPLVENAIRHGLGTFAGGRVEIHARLRGDRLVLSVRDDGVGLSPTLAQEGVGLRNTRLRLAELHGAAAGVRLAAGRGRGTEVELTLPACASPHRLAPSHAPERPPREVPRAPSPARLAVAILASWGGLGILWAGLSTVGRLSASSLVDALRGSMPQAALFAGVTLGVAWLLSRWPPERAGARWVRVGLTLGGVGLLCVARGLMRFGWAVPSLDETVVVNLLLDGSVGLVILAGTQATWSLRRAGALLEEASRREAELAAAAWRARLAILEGPRLLITLDQIDALVERDPERADDLAVALGQELRTRLVEGVRA